MSVVTRFPPSPTGYFHIGSARTALYSWLHARKNNGRFILRIEDTDRERSTEEAVRVILEGMDWLGLDYDEGPHYQTQRMERYQEVVRQMLATDLAYYCYCSKEELEHMREQARARGNKPRYDGRCRHRQAPDPNIEPVVRFKNPLQGQVVFDDLIKGRIAISNEELDDLIIARSDGTPTYNFCVVVDDLDMGVTHVIRGDDHVNNTPRQINILQSLGAKVPVYAHVPMILGQDGKRLSKRHGAVSVLQYREEGYLPHALLNYLMRLGWSHGDQELFSEEEMLQLFVIEQVHRSAATFDPEKLLWLNYEYMKTYTPQQLLPHARPLFDAAGIDIEAHPKWQAVFQVNQERSKTLVELLERSRFFFQEISEYDPAAAKKHFKADAGDLLKQVREGLSGLQAWAAEPIHQQVHAIAEGNGVGLGKVAQPIRVAVAGNAVSPPIDVTLEILGRDATLTRLDRALAFMVKA